MSDETILRAARRVLKKEEFDGEDRRAPPAPDYMKYLPLVIAVLAGVAGYVRMEAQVDFNAQRIQELRESNKAQWSRIGEVMGRSGGNPFEGRMDEMQ